MLVKGWKARVNQPPDSDVKTLGYAFAFFRAAQRAFLTPITFSWQRHSLEDGFYPSWEQTFPSTLPNAVSSLLKSACGPMHLYGHVEA
jgi:hypothetical protein